MCPTYLRPRLCSLHNRAHRQGVGQEFVPKYEPLGSFLASLPKAQKQITMSFRRIEDMIGEALPPSALEYEQWWWGGHVKRGRIDANWRDQVQQRAWEDAGWTVEDLSLSLRTVTFRRR